MFLTPRIYICRLTQNPNFIIRINDGIASVFSGRPKTGFVNDCQEIVSRNNISCGFIYGIKSTPSSPLILKCSPELRNVRQQIRNVWCF